ncbi:unnamed protein product [Schistosoma curassoni]|uniref:Cytochrome b6/f complex subunit VI n=1 Tax=Schistosoma curassoni TaxID=6186 RepID=A0A183JU08_9TREM|nr:unnamed protein product [Schistosoma curassoni]
MNIILYGSIFLLTGVAGVTTNTIYHLILKPMN